VLEVVKEQMYLTQLDACYDRC